MSHKTTKLAVHSLKLELFAQASPSASLKLPHLACTSVKQWFLYVISLRWALLAWASHTFAPNNAQTSPGRGFDEKMHQFTSWTRLGEPLSPRRKSPLLRTQNFSPDRQVALK